MREFLSYIFLCRIRQREFVRFEFVRPRVAGRCPQPQAGPKGQAVQPNPPFGEGHGVKEEVG